ncbi:phage holin family protein [Limisphaera sp. VF-2]|jgi:putative membrane protein|uniref:phage holin family protein n=1 Tax=Limisphaera sp. VF-2 TaxID=3400418 RepID=UPI00176A708D|nr:phage holin family protein [Limisphaera sp.]
MKRFLQNWLIGTCAVLVAVYVVPGVHYEKPLDVLVASLLLGILNAFVRPVLLVLTLPLVLVTLGLFVLVINGLLLWLVSWLMRPHFYVEDFWAAFWGALVISVVSALLGRVAGVHKTSSPGAVDRPPPSGPRGGRGPVIDI